MHSVPAVEPKEETSPYMLEAAIMAGPKPALGNSTTSVPAWSGAFERAMSSSIAGPVPSYTASVKTHRAASKGTVSGLRRFASISRSTPSTDAAGPRARSESVPRVFMEPVVEIRSSDPKIAARVAAILKLQHDFTQDGSPAIEDLDGNRLEAAAGLDDDLREAETELSMYGDTTTTRMSMSPAKSSHRRSVSALSHSRLLNIQSPQSADGRSWTKADWRLLEATIKEAQRELYETGKPDYTPAEVVRMFLRKVNVDEAAVSNHWSQ